MELSFEKTKEAESVNAPPNPSIVWYFIDLKIDKKIVIKQKWHSYLIGWSMRKYHTHRSLTTKLAKSWAMGMQVTIAIIIIKIIQE